VLQKKYKPLGEAPDPSCNRYHPATDGGPEEENLER
jgi:hypothetical protein